MKEQSLFKNAIIRILPGFLLLELTSISSSIPAIILGFFGCFIIIKGYKMIETLEDEYIQKAIRILKIAIYLSITAFFVDIIPMAGVIASLLYAVAFVLHILGYFSFKKSPKLTYEAQSGINFILIAFVISIFSALSGILPFIGEAVSSWLIMFSYILIILGWLKVFEENLVETTIN